MVILLTYGMIGGGNGTIAKRHPRPHTYENTKVADIIENGHWKLDPIDGIVDDMSHNEILIIVFLFIDSV